MSLPPEKLKNIIRRFSAVLDEATADIPQPDAPTPNPDERPNREVDLSPHDAKPATNAPDKNPITFLILTASKEHSKDKSTADKINHLAEKKGIKSHFLTMHGLLYEASGSELIIHQHGQDPLTVSPRDTVVFVRGSAVTTEGMALVDALERRGAQMVNGYGATLLAQNKLQTALVFSQAGIKVPRTVFVSGSEVLDQMPDLGWPLVAKTLTGAEGIGITLIREEKDLKSSVENYLRTEKGILLQQFVKSETDYRALCLNGKAIAATRRTKSKSDFRSNLGHGVVPEPHRLTPAEVEWAERVAAISGLFYVAIDFVREDDELLLFEVNGSPGSGSKYFDMENKKEIEGDALVELLVDTMADRKNWRPKKITAGVIEWMAIEDRAPEPAKLDTGNSSYNSLHALDIEVVGEEGHHTVKFTLGSKPMERPLVSWVLIGSGPGKETDRRPVVELDCAIDGRSFPNTRFNLTDRSEKEYTILMGARFLEHAGVVVDASAKNLLKTPRTPL